MYADFFGFRELPFNNTPDPRFFYSTPDHEEALASLIYAVKARKGFVLLSGEIGAGKTLVTRMMLRHFGTQIAFATIHHTVHSPEDLIESICTEFELPVKSRASTTQTVRVLHDYLLAEFAQNIPVVLVLDEAQSLPVEAFEQLRMIGNLEADDAKLLQIAIVGQPELQRKFLSPELRQLRQRVFRMFHLPALNEEATNGYIHHRLSVAGGDTGAIFDKDAISAVYRFSRGVPRLINTVCDNALLSAYSADRPTLDRPFIESVIAQMLTGTPGAGSTEDAFVSTLQGSTGEACEHSVAAASPPVAQPTESAGGSHAPRPEPAAAPGPMRRHTRPAQPARDDGIPAASISDLHTRADSRDPAPASRPGGRVGTAAGVRAKVEEAKRRIAAVERRLHGATGGLAEARAIHASLKPLVDQARTYAGRAEAALQELKRRDAQFRPLATTVKSAVRDLRHLVDRARETASRTSHAESDARAVHDRLVAQSRRSRRVADELTQLVDRMVSADSSASSTPQVVKDRSSRSEGHRDPPVPWRSGQGTPHQVQRDLHSTREALSDLRRLARRAPAQSAATHPTTSDLPTTRLAQQVEDLLELVAADGGLNAM